MVEGKCLWFKKDKKKEKHKEAQGLVWGQFFKGG
jgi:methionine salvage enolase-phosphatase E1